MLYLSSRNGCLKELQLQLLQPRRWEVSGPLSAWAWLYYDFKNVTYVRAFTYRRPKMLIDTSILILQPYLVRVNIFRRSCWWRDRSSVLTMTCRSIHSIKQFFVQSYSICSTATAASPTAVIPHAEASDEPRAPWRPGPGRSSRVLYAVNQWIRSKGRSKCSCR